MTSRGGPNADRLSDALRVEADHLYGILASARGTGELLRGELGAIGDRTSECARRAYVGLLRLSADYVQFTVAALEAAAGVLYRGDAQDRQWADRMRAYAQEETGSGDASGDDPSVGHEVWAYDDLAEIGIRDAAARTAHPAAAEYGWYFVHRAAAHPYAILGAKSVLEALSVRAAEPILASLRALDAAPEAATRFVRRHGVADVAHVRVGSADLRRLHDGDHRRQVLEGAYMTTGMYRQLADHYLR